ncbi:hypothetical protein G7075_11105 [Phycicoccus sp. HDW14]|uniref:hypothetical protein n=1 Tax=Phycicoccus sp. HDW14 TaxID=2714941 RepID=UPI0014098E39|nr:hypothetical protein [Phycicoccus sp. HDW14]QIM21550.1 hypothetical protein G7075_11105 [Phycicoccus sp. HDW14]
MTVSTAGGPPSTRTAGVGLAGLAVVAALALVGAFVGRPGADPVFLSRAGAPAVVRAADVHVECGGAGVNTGTIDGSGGWSSPLAAAERWWAGTGFATQYPGARLRVLDGTQSLVVVAQDVDGSLRAALQFDREGTGWTWSEARYC